MRTYFNKAESYYESAEKTIITITDKYNVKHVYECIDEFFTLYEFEYNGSKYLVFRKTLYGYTILNLTDFSEINYFPSDVLDGKEAFIICEAKLLQNVLVLGGCFWAGPYECRALRLDTLETANVSELCGITDVAVGGITISDGTLVLRGDEDKIITLTYEQLLAFINSKHAKDL